MTLGDAVRPGLPAGVAAPLPSPPGCRPRLPLLLVPWACRWPGSEGQERDRTRTPRLPYAVLEHAPPREGEDIQERAERAGDGRMLEVNVTPSLKGVFHPEGCTAEIRGPSRGPAWGPGPGGRGGPQSALPGPTVSLSLPGCGLPGEANLCTPKWGWGAETEADRVFRMDTPVCSHARWSPKFWAAGATEVRLAVDSWMSVETRGGNVPAMGAGARLCPVGLCTLTRTLCARHQQPAPNAAR